MKKGGSEKKRHRIFFSSGFFLQYRDRGKGVKISGVLRSVGSYHMYAFVALSRHRSL